jgi:hypothetical protein
VIDSSARLEGICGLRGLWLLSTIIVSSFSSCVLSTLTPVWTLLGALPLAGDLLLELCLLGSSDGVDDGSPVEVVFSLPLWLPFIIAADSAGVALKVTRSLRGFSFVDGTK